MDEFDGMISPRKRVPTFSRSLSRASSRGACVEILVGLFIVIVAVVIAVGIFCSAQRRKELAAWAAANGLSFSPASDSSMDVRFGEFSCLDEGHDRYADSIMTGEWADPDDRNHPLPGSGLTGLAVCAFDYHYTTGSGKNQQTHSFSAVVAASPLPLEPLLIRPEGVFDKVAEFFGADDIDFESAEFSRQFFVKSPDKRWAYAVVDQRMMAFLLAVPRYHVQFTRTHIMAWGSSTFSAAEFGSAVRLIRGMLERLPDYLVRQQTGK